MDHSALELLVFSHINVHGTGINANGAIGLYAIVHHRGWAGIGAIYFANSDGNPGAYIQGQWTELGNERLSGVLYFYKPDGHHQQQKTSYNFCGKIGIELLLQLICWKLTILQHWF